MSEFKMNTPSEKETKMLTESTGQELIKDIDSNKVFDSNIESTSSECQESRNTDNLKTILCENSFSKYNNAKVIGTANLTIPGNLPEEYKSYHDALGKKIIDEVGTQNLNYQEQLKSLGYTINRDRIPILLLGETGTGKSTLAEKIHKISRRKEIGKFVEYNCSNLSGDLLNSELFGHEKGAFTGATKLKIGLVELADKGVLFLDEIDKADKKTRAALLKFIDTGYFFRVGGEKKIKSDVRIICGSNLDLQGLVENDSFEREFYHRIAGLAITIPPLRRRKEDIDSLVQLHCQKISKEANESLPVELIGIVVFDFKLEPDALQLIKHFPLKGNIRELFNLLDNLFAESSKRNTTTATKSIVLETLHHDQYKSEIRSLQNLEKNLSDVFFSWYNSERIDKRGSEKNNNGKSKINDGFLQLIVIPILANIYDSTDSSELGIDKDQKNKMARSIIGIGGYTSGKDSSSIDKALETYKKLIEQKKQFLLKHLNIFK